MKKLLLILLFCCCTPVLSVEMECGKTQFHMDNDIVYDCFADLQSNTIGFFMRNNLGFGVVYGDEHYGITCYHKTYSRRCSTYYECIITNGDGRYWYDCKTQKKAKEIKNRLRKAK